LGKKYLVLLLASLLSFATVSTPKAFGKEVGDGDGRQSIATAENSNLNGALKIDQLRDFSGIDPNGVILRLKYDSVLDTYGYFYCTVHNGTCGMNIPVYNPTYRNISFKNGYSRKYPDTFLTQTSNCPRPNSGTHTSHYGVIRWYKCNYTTW
jgi:hypothetical protein